ncbi:MAG: hypothetical protein J7L76_05770 [Spirochaetaceae bacterium]|nr:hypothetical protein [Spirochaetaceae bacterium]RKX90534.1 MAG: hypothetical protein DRP70_00395 [Spirochaetota bacterium]
MKIHDINQLRKKDIPLYYRNEYEGWGDIEFSSGSRQQVPIKFTVEIKPTGERAIDVKLKERIDYPLVPVIRALKEKIKLLEENGDLR